MQDSFPYVHIASLCLSSFSDFFIMEIREG